MTSPSPLLYDTYYHIYNRGNNRENIFIQERNYEHFMNLYFKYIDPIAETFAYCLLRNHFHETLKVSFANPRRVWQEIPAYQDEGQQGKPFHETLKVSFANPRRVWQEIPAY